MTQLRYGFCGLNQKLNACDGSQIKPLNYSRIESENLIQIGSGESNHIVNQEHQKMPILMKTPIFFQ